jgi:hypothetical protein
LPKKRKHEDKSLPDETFAEMKSAPILRLGALAAHKPAHGGRGIWQSPKRPLKQPQLHTIF